MTELSFLIFLFIFFFCILQCCFPSPCNGVWQKVAYSPHTPHDISQRRHVGSPVKNTARPLNTVNFVPNLFFVPFFFLCNVFEWSCQHSLRETFCLLEGILKKCMTLRLKITRRCRRSSSFSLGSPTWSDWNAKMKLNFYITRETT